MADQRIRPSRNAPLFDELLKAGSLMNGAGNPNTSGPLGGAVVASPFNTFLDTASGQFYEYQADPVDPLVPWLLTYTVPGGPGGSGTVTGGENIGPDGVGIFDNIGFDGVTMSFKKLRNQELPGSETININDEGLLGLKLGVIPENIFKNDLGGSPLDADKGGTGQGVPLLLDETLRGSGGNVMQVVANNYQGGSNPTVANDSGQGFRIGSEWVNTISKEEWVCIKAVAPAEWKQLNTTKNNFSSFLDPLPTDNEDEGYQLGSLWINLSLQKTWILTKQDNPGIWTELGDATPDVDSFYRQQDIVAHTISTVLQPSFWTGWLMQFGGNTYTNTAFIESSSLPSFTSFRYIGNTVRRFRVTYNLNFLYDAQIAVPYDFFDFALVVQNSFNFTPSPSPAGLQNGSIFTHETPAAHNAEKFSVSGDYIVEMQPNDYVGVVVRASFALAVDVVTNSNGSFSIQAV